MEKAVYCPKCGNAVLKQIETVHWRIQTVCADCRTNLVLTFENGTLISVIYDEKETAAND